MKKLRMALLFSTVVSMLACDGNLGGGSNVNSSNNDSMYLSSYPSSNNNLRVSLTDAPSKDLKSVFVNIDHVELFVKKGGNEGRLIIAQNLGMIDLMTLRNGVLLPLQDLSLPIGLEITAMRLVLKGNDNHSIKSDDSRCDMQTPSGQQSGIKIILSQSFVLEQGQVYSMVMDFDAEKSVVIKGNGDCLLKPVLKLLTVTRTPATSGGESEGDNSNPGSGEEVPVTDGNDSNTTADVVSDGSGAESDSGENSGFEAPPTDGSEETPIYTIEDTYNFG